MLTATEWKCDECKSYVVIEPREAPFFGKIFLVHCSCSFVAGTSLGKMDARANRKLEEFLDH